VSRAEVERLAHSKGTLVKVLEYVHHVLTGGGPVEADLCNSVQLAADRLAAEVARLRTRLRKCEDVVKRAETAEAENERLREEMKPLLELTGVEEKLLRRAMYAEADAERLRAALRAMVERYAKHSGLCVPVIDGKMGDVTEESCVCEPLYKQARAALRGGERESNVITEGSTTYVRSLHPRGGR
jgi:hypothetical protein